MDTILIVPVVLPIIAGLVCMLIPERSRAVRSHLAQVVALVSIALGIYLLYRPELNFNLHWFTVGDGLDVSINLKLTAFARLGLVASGIFAYLIWLYSSRIMHDHPRHREYFAYFLMSLGIGSGILLSNDFILLLFFWDLLGLMLYLMVMVSGLAAAPSATKAFLIALTGDMALTLGVALLWIERGSLVISDLSAEPQLLASPATLAAFLLMLAGGFTKLGVAPLHTWIPAISTQALMPVMSYFTLFDKFIGVYLISRLTLEWFVLPSWIHLMLMVFGSVTLLSGVLMAMIQHDYRRMLAFHSVSQVGYMVLGIGTGTPVGIIGGIFHMLNMVIVKGSLYLCGGSVQQQTGRADFSKLGGLASAMPWTFAATLVAALGISGVPPLNAFVSKWLIYQGILEFGGPLYPIFLIVAMFGSALTLASFMKLMYSMFWGSRPRGLERTIESRSTMVTPVIILAGIAVLFGIFYQPAIEYLIQPLFTSSAGQAVEIGFWQAGSATVLLILSLAAGIPIYLLSRVKPAASAEVFLGGEALNPEYFRVRGTHFYGPVKEFQGLKQLYALGEAGAFDIYLYAVRSVKWTTKLIYKYVDQSLGEFYQEVIPALLSLSGQIMRVLTARLFLTRLIWIVYAASLVSLWVYPQNHDLLMAIRYAACIGMVGWGLLAWVETDLKRLIILAATSQFGFVLLGITLSIQVALSYFLTGGAALFTLALIVRSISRKVKTTDIEKMEGLAAQMPIRVLVFLIAALWLSGLPPFGSFFSKYRLGVAAGEISPFLAVIITGSALLTLAYFLRPIRKFSRSD